MAVRLFGFVANGIIPFIPPTAVEEDILFSLLDAICLLRYTPAMARSVYASAPTRIDFAGGTLDIYPLFLFVGGAVTLNAAIDLSASVTISARADGRIIIYSRDTGIREEAPSLADLSLAGPLSLVSRVLHHYLPAGGLDIETYLLPPHGSGLGASSALLVALTHAMCAYLDRPRDPERLIRLCNNLEAQLMGMPAGIQDYYPPSYGGIKAIHSEVEEIYCEHLELDGNFLDELQRHLIVTYTNMTHHSGTTNWTKFRNFFDGVPLTVQSFHQLKCTADKMYASFLSHDIPAIASVLDEEWANRRNLSDSVTNPKIDGMMEQACDAGAWSSKLCGAGGGGCMLTIAPLEVREKVIDALINTGCSFLNTKLVQKGVTVEIS